MQHRNCVGLFMRKDDKKKGKRNLVSSGLGLLKKILDKKGM